MINACSSSFLFFSGSCCRNSQLVGHFCDRLLDFHASRGQMLSEMEAARIFYCSDHCVCHVPHFSSAPNDAPCASSTCRLLTEVHPCCPHGVASPDLQKSGSPSPHMPQPPSSSEGHLPASHHQDYQEL